MDFVRTQPHDEIQLFPTPNRSKVVKFYSALHTVVLSKRLAASRSLAHIADFG